MVKLPVSYYLNEDVVGLAKSLLGKVIYTAIDGELTSGVIVETEAYNGHTDRASHAFGGRLTPRTKTMYENGGVAYVYLCYGMHHLLNVVTGPLNQPQAVLIRGVEPKDGLITMLQRRKLDKLSSRLSAGPGVLANALGVDLNCNGKSLLGNEIWIEDHGIEIPSDLIVCGPRIGVDYAGEDALLDWRFYVKGNQFVSKPNK